MESMENKNEEKEKIYFVSREKARPKTKEELEDEAKFGKWKGADDGHDYSGCFYTVGFKTDMDIYIHGLQFLGPSKETKNPYMVSFRVQRMTEDWSGMAGLFRCLWPWGPYFKIEELSSTILRSVRVTGQPESFMVDFPYPVHVEADKWTDIKFELKGPPTKRIAKMATREQVMLEHSMVTFEFLHGSRQLLGIHFSVD